MDNWKDNFPKENIYFETQNGILYHGDCIEVLEKFNNNSINTIITSPPYNVGIKYDTYEDNLNFEEYQKFLENLLILFKKILTDDGRFGINHSFDVNRPIRYSPINLLINLINKVGLNYYTIISLVEKNPHRVKFTAWGSWLSPSSPYIYNPTEGIVVGYKKQWKKLTKGRTDLTKEEFMELVSGLWKYEAEKRKLTQANFSIDIPYKWIKINTYSDKNEIVLDPFMGSGTTALAAEKLGRKWIGIELSKNYCEVIKNRINKEILNKNDE